MSKLLGRQVQFAQAESKDFDIIARYVANDEVSYVPVQLKEWVPGSVNPQASLQGEIDKLAKYADSKDLVVAFYLNRRAHVTFSELQLPEDYSANCGFSRRPTLHSRDGCCQETCSMRMHRSYDFLYPTG